MIVDIVQTIGLDYGFHARQILFIYGRILNEIPPRSR